MKRSSFLFLSCLILALQANFILSIAQNFSSGPVLDTSGEELHQGVSYNILSAQRGNRLLVTTNASICPLFPIVIEGTDGVAVRFFPVTNDSVIPVDTDTNIRFFINLRSPVICPRTGFVWRINNTGSGPIFVTTGGVLGDPGRQTLPNWFKIHKYEDAYQLQYCPSPSTCGANCGVALLCENIGVVVENGIRRLALTNGPPFKVAFQRR